MRRFWLILAAFIGLAASAVPAAADITWTLTQGGSLGPTPGNYGTILAQQNGASIRVTITLAPGNLFVTTGQHSGITWNMTAVPNALPGGIQIVSSNANLFTVQPLNGSYENSPFSNNNAFFQYAISWNGNGAGSATQSQIIFDITKTGGLVLANVFTPNANGYYWGVDIGTGCVVPAHGGTTCAGTGVVAALPEPGTWTMAIAGLMGLMGFAVLERRRRVFARAA